MLSSVRPKSVARKSHTPTRAPDEPPSTSFPARVPPTNTNRGEQNDVIDKNTAENNVLMIPPRNSSPSPVEQSNGRGEGAIHSVFNQSAMQMSKDQSDPPPPVSVPPPKPDRAWARHLISLRRRVRKEGSLENWDSGVSANSDEAWLSTQHEALTSGSLSMTMKCVLAAAEISTAFSAHAADFQKPEYRMRYWTWCTRFMKLVDVVLDERRPDPNVDQTSTDCPQDIIDFVQNMREQRAQGLLPQPKEALLSALGVRWTTPLQSQARQGNSVTATKRGHVGEKDTGRRENQNSERSKDPEKKRRRSEAADGAEKCEQHSTDGGTSSRLSMKKWASEFVKLRTYYRSHGSGQGQYEVPVEAADVKIWRNAEIARVSTGGSSVYCFAILKCANVIDENVEHSFKPGRELSYWCLLFVHFVDAVIEKRAHFSQNTRTFLARCCTTELAGKLPSSLRGLLDGVLPSWRKMGLSTPRPDGSPPSVTFAGADAAGELPLEVPNTVSLSHPMEREMVTTMIRGLVAECVGGEKKTSEQRQAEEWVAKAGVDALNRYARTWVQRMDFD